MRFFLMAACVLEIVSNLAVANTASPFPIEVTQPGGEKVTLFLRGNEQINWYEFVPEAADMQPTLAMQPEYARVAATPGYTVVQDDQQRYVFADLAANGMWTASDRVVGQAAPEGERRLMPSPAMVQTIQAQRLPDPNIPSRSAAPVGQVKNLVILLRFSDHASRVLPSRAEFETLFNAAAPDPVIAPTGSVNAFYKENSYNQLDLQSHVVDWVTLPNTEAFYADGQSGLSVRIRQAIRDGLNLVAASGVVDFSDFDNENGGTGDGWIDSITFVHSGYAAEFGGTAGGAAAGDRIWSHRWAIGTWTDPASAVRVSDYNINPGIWGTSGNRIGRIGVICHELGHFFGLPDLYDTSGQGEGIGSWGLMANSWGFDGSQLHPPHMCAWSKIALNWNTATPITGAGVYSLEPTSSPAATIYRIDYSTSTGDEYLLIENRQPTGAFESGIPAGSGGSGGLAIWHIDDLMPENNRPGCPGLPGYPANHYKIALLQADGACDLEHNRNRGDANDLFRGGHVDSLLSLDLPGTSPHSTSYSGTKLEPITLISTSGPVMQFTYGTPAPPPAGGGSVLAGSVRLENPASHSVTFSDDHLAATLKFDRLESFVLGLAHTHTTQAMFSLPLSAAGASSKAKIHVRGYFSGGDKTAGSVLLAVNSTRTLIDPTEHAASPSTTSGQDKRSVATRAQPGMPPKPSASAGIDFFHESIVELQGAEQLTFSLTLVTNTETAGSNSVLLVVDSVDIELQ